MSILQMDWDTSGLVRPIFAVVVSIIRVVRDILSLVQLILPCGLTFLLRNNHLGRGSAALPGRQCPPSRPAETQLCPTFQFISGGARHSVRAVDAD